MFKIIIILSLLSALNGYVLRPHMGVLFDHSGTLDINEQYFYYTIGLLWPEKINLAPTTECKENYTKGYQHVICNFAKDLKKKMDTDVQQLDYEVQTAIKHLKLMLPKFTKLPGRGKRGLLNIVGDLGTFLFGLVNEGQFKKLAQHVENIESGVLSTIDQMEKIEGTVSQFSELTSNRLDNLTRTLQNNQDKTTKYLRVLSARMNQNIKGLQSQWTRLHERQDVIARSLFTLMDSLVYHMELLTSAGDIHNSWISAIELIINGKLPISLIPPSKLTKILEQVTVELLDSQSLVHLELTHTDLAYYYHSCRIVSGTSDKALYLQLKIPVHSPTSLFDIYSIDLFPVMVPNNRSAVRLQHNFRYFALSRDSKLQIDLNAEDLLLCDHNHPRHCKGSMNITSVTKESCLASILLDWVNAPGNCNMDIALYYNKTYLKKIGQLLLISDPNHRMHLYCDDGNWTSVKPVCQLCVMNLPCYCTLTLDGIIQHEAALLCTMDNSAPRLFETFKSPFVYHYSKLIGFKLPEEYNNSDMAKLPKLPDITNILSEDSKFSRSMKETLEQIHINNQWHQPNLGGIWDNFDSSLIIECIQGVLILVSIVIIVALVIKLRKQNQAMIQVGSNLLKQIKGDN